ncbi:hypothetical protein FBEOM_7089 [Fusarium beomiforme]|uniref:Uncharacterized protein n=1 Tax=Fusarium beomiforme TaxID=44412 RepID=A0A9P5AHX4_9HYPO|nr:hypothetical protein FBEOM_7089 [Fusarium beomiforme]
MLYPSSSSSKRENEDGMVRKSQFWIHQVSNHTALLVNTRIDSHLSLPINFLPLFEAVLALNMNHEDYQNGEEPAVVRVKMEVAIRFIGDLIAKEEKFHKEAAEMAETMRQEQDEYCELCLNRVVEHAEKVGVDTNGYTWQGIHRALASRNNEAFDDDQTYSYWGTLVWWNW